jgi:hypothetical protein
MFNPATISKAQHSSQTTEIGDFGIATTTSGLIEKKRYYTQSIFKRPKWHSSSRHLSTLETAAPLVNQPNDTETVSQVETRKTDFEVFKS